MFRKLAVATVAALVLTGLAAAPSVASPPTPSGDDRLAVYSGTVDAEGFAAIVDLGVDRSEVVTAPSADGAGLIDVQVILSGGQVEALAAQRHRAADPGRPVGAASQLRMQSPRACSGCTAATAASWTSSWRRPLSTPRSPSSA